MSESQAQSREELIAKRDEIVEQLQGRWEPERDTSALRQRAMKRGVHAGITMLIGLPILMACLWMFDSFESVVFSSSMLVDDGKPNAVEIMLAIVAMSIGGGALLAGLMYLLVAFYGKSGPVIVEGTQLRKEKKQGYVPERIELTGLVGAYGQGRKGDMVPPYGFLTAPVMNTPEIMPDAYKDGDKLAGLLVELAAVNRAIGSGDE